MNVSPYYENIEFNVTTGTTDYDLDAQQADFLAVFNQDATVGVGVYPTYLRFRTDNTVSFKLNSTSDNAVTITSTDSPYEVDGVEIRNIYITNNSGSTAAIKIWLQLSPNK